MTSKVAVAKLDGDAESVKQTLHLIGVTDDLNTVERSVVIKVGVFSHRADNPGSLDVVDAVIDSLHAWKAGTSHTRRISDHTHAQG